MENGVETRRFRLSKEKISVLRLLAEAHNNYWRINGRVRKHRDVLAESYAVTCAYTDGLWRDLVNDDATVTLDRQWEEVNDEARRLEFALRFPPNYVGVLEKYEVRDERFADSGATFTARTIRPAPWRTGGGPTATST